MSPSCLSCVCVCWSSYTVKFGVVRHGGVARDDGKISQCCVGKLVPVVIITFTDFEFIFVDGMTCCGYLSHVSNNDWSSLRVFLLDFLCAIVRPDTPSAGSASAFDLPQSVR